MKYTVYLYVGMILAGGTFSGCSDDDDPVDTPQEEMAYTTVDELKRVQQALVAVDDDGKFVGRVCGVPLNPTDTTEVSVGVDTYDEAVEKFGLLFADTTVISNNGLLATFSTREGKAELKKGDGKDGLLAYATFDVPGLKYVSRLNYIQNSAWPENATAQSMYKVGTVWHMTAWTADEDDPDYVWPTVRKDELFDFVCIRSDKNGNPALLVAMTDCWYKLAYAFTGSFTGNLPDEKKAKEISAILRSNWSTYTAFFNQSFSCLREGQDYWIDSGGFYLVCEKRDAITLSTGEVERWEVGWKRPAKPVLFYREVYGRY